MFFQNASTYTEGMIDDIMRRVNAYGHQPRIVVELDLMRYVSGIKAKYPVIDYVINQVNSTYDMYDPTVTTITPTSGGTVTSYPQTDSVAIPLMGKSWSDVAVTDTFDLVGTGGHRIHKGIDLALNTGDPICAAWDGKVTVAGWVTGYGNCVYLDHGNGLTTRYGHMSEVDCNVGQVVTKGQLIGKGGATGDATGPHLHFEVRQNDNPIDPKPILSGSSSARTSVYQTDGTNTSVNVKTVVSEEAVTFYRDFNSPLTNVDAKFSNFTNGPEIFPMSATSGKIVKLYGFKGVTGGQFKGFDFTQTWNRDGYLDFDYYANLTNDGDVVKVYMDGNVILEIHGNDGVGQKGWVVPPKIKVAKGTHTFQFHMYNDTDSNSVFGVQFIKTAEFTDGTDPKQVRKVDYSYNDIQVNKDEKWYDVGTFVYQDSFTLENDIVNWEINGHFDQGSAVASITLDNANGFYSPDYDPSNVIYSGREVPQYTYFENGRYRHVISEGTPVRIYVGYGDNVVRRFTGKIKGEIQEDANSRTVTFNCVDMYDKCEQTVLYQPISFPAEDEIDVETGTFNPWLKSAIVQYLANFAGLSKWRMNWEDQFYPDMVIQDTYYTDIREDSKTVIKFVDGVPKAVPMTSIKTADGYKNPFVEMIRFEIGEKVSDCIQNVISDINFRVYCDWYGTFRLEEIVYFADTKWDFTDDNNLQELGSSIDYSKVRNHLMIAGAEGVYEHFFDKDLIIATKGEIRSAGLKIPWIDETLGDARSAKQVVAERLFFDMKRIARTKNIVIKGNPLVDIMDGCYIKDTATSTAGYYIVKGNRMVGNKQGMVNYLECTWQEDV